MIKVLFCLLMFAGLSMAQDAASAQKAARELSGAVKTGDMMWMVEKMYPAMKNKLAHNLKGGMKELEETYRKMGEIIKQQGIKLEAFDVMAPVGEYSVKANTEKLVVLPTRTIVAVKNPQTGQMVRIEKLGFLYAVSKIGENEPWYFIDGATIKVNDLRNLIYDVPLNIVQPPVSQKILP